MDLIEVNGAADIHEGRTTRKRRKTKKSESEREKSELRRRKAERDQQGHLLPNLKTIIQSYSRGTTFHGIAYIADTGNVFTKLFWATVLLGVFSVVAIQLSTLVNTFLQNPTVTAINFAYPAEGLKLPSLVICTLTKINNSKLQQKYPEIDPTLAAFTTSVFHSAYGTALIEIGYFEALDREPASLQKTYENITGNMTILDFMKDITFDCAGQFLQCWFQNGFIFNCCNNANKTKRKDLSMDPDPRNTRMNRFFIHSGPCYQFETEVLRQQLPGPVGGFGFVFWYPNNHLFQSVFNAYDEHAVHLFTSPTDAMLEKNAVVLPVGSHAHISLQLTKTTRLMKDQLGRSTCKPKELKYFDNYTYAGCQVECLIDAMLTECGCISMVTYAEIPTDKLCNPFEAYDCYKKLAPRYNRLLTECREKECTESCTYWTYKPSQTIGKVFNPKVEKEMVEYWRLPNDSSPRNSLVICEVYFTDIQYTDVKQMSAFTLESFVSNLGGALGLWTGASVITWIHLVYFCCAHMCTKLQADNSDMDSDYSDHSDFSDEETHRRHRQTHYLLETLKGADPAAHRSPPRRIGLVLASEV